MFALFHRLTVFYVSAKKVVSMFWHNRRGDEEFVYVGEIFLHGCL